MRHPWAPLTTGTSRQLLPRAANGGSRTAGQLWPSELDALAHTTFDAGTGAKNRGGGRHLGGAEPYPAVRTTAERKRVSLCRGCTSRAPSCAYTSTVWHLANGSEKRARACVFYFECSAPDTRSFDPGISLNGKKNAKNVQKGRLHGATRY